MKRYKKYITADKSSATLEAILYFVYRKDELSRRIGRYSERVVNGLIDLGLLKRVESKTKGTFYFVTDKAKGLRAIDLAKEFLWNYHNPTDRVKKHNKKLIYCFDSELPNGSGLIEVEMAIKKCYV